MRLSIDVEDPGHAPWLAIPLLRRSGIKVFLDGVERDKVVTADEEKRFIVRAQTDERGEIIVKDDDVMMETLHGTVRIEVPE